MKKLLLPFTHDRQRHKANVQRFLEHNPEAVTSAKASRMWIVPKDAAGQNERSRCAIGLDAAGGTVGTAESIAASIVSLLRDRDRADITVEFD